MSIPPRVKGGSIVAPEDTDPSPQTNISIPQLRFFPDAKFGLRRVMEFGHYQGALAALHFFRDEWATVEGSAVIVAPGVAITASHVIEPLKEEILHQGLLQYAAAPKRSDEMMVWRLSKITPIPGTDLTILSLYPGVFPADRQFPQMSVTARIPKIGEKVMIAGFQSDAELLDPADGVYFSHDGKDIRTGLKLLASVGRVTASFPHGRRKAGPTIEVDCDTPGGMSGGAAFDKHGNVFGVLSSSIAGGPSYVSLIWPALGAPFPSTFPFFPEAFVSLLDYQPQFCSIRFRDLMRVRTLDDGEIAIDRLRDPSLLAEAKAAFATCTLRVKNRILHLHALA